MKNLLFLFLPIFAFAQEQISNIEYYGLYEPTYISAKVGFASIAGEQYLLQENDSLVIYKFSNGDFEVSAVIPNNDCRKYAGQTHNPNRSLFEIRDSLYYRFMEDGLQVIEITTGEIRFDYDFSHLNFYRLIDKIEDRIYLRASNQEMILHLNTGMFDTLNISSPHLSTLRYGDHVIGVTENQDVSLYNSNLKMDSILFQSTFGIKETSFSRQDSSFIFVENDGSIWKVRKDYSIYKSNGSLSTLANLTRYWVNGNSLIEIFRNSILDNGYDIVVSDLTTGQEELRFGTGELPSYVKSFQNVITESDDKNYSIIGFSGFNPTDGLNEGRYYVIDHETQIQNALPTLSWVRDHSPFIHDGKIYMIGVYSSYWGVGEFIVSYNLSNNNTDFLYPSGNETKYVTIGFPSEGRIINASNSKEEDNVVWKLEPNNSFSQLMSLSFLKNFGAVNISDYTIVDDEIFFKSAGGLYSIKNETTLRLAINRKEGFIPYSTNDPEILVSGNKLTIVDYNDTMAIFKVYNTDTDTVDSLVTNEKISGGTVVLGEYLAYYERVSESVHCFDPKDMSISVFDSLQYISSSSYSIAKGITRGIRIENIAPNGNWAGYKAILFNYEEKNAKRINLDFHRSIDVAAGYDDSFYLTDGHDKSEEDTRVRLFDKEENVSVIYEGVGRPYGNYNYAGQTDHPVSVIHLMEGSKTSIIITNNLDTTEVLQIPNEQYGPYNETVLNQLDDKFILHTVDSLGVHFWYYEAFKPLLEVFTGNDVRHLFSDFTEDSAIIWVDNGNDQSTLIKYNFITGEITKIENIDMECSFPYQRADLYLGDDKFVMSSRCNVGYEPYVLDVNEGTFQILHDINNGAASGNPNNFIKLQNQLYFSSIVKDNSRQWFKTILDTDTAVKEISLDLMHDIIAFPSPTKDFLSLNHNVKYLQIYSINGELCLSRSDYIKDQIFDISKLASGMYIIVVEDNQSNISSVKFIKTD